MTIPPSNRQLRVAELIRKTLIEVLQKGKMLDVVLLNTPITITRVFVTPDLKLAECNFLPSALQKANIDELLAALENSKHAIRRSVTSKLKLKYSPELVFKYDHGFENADIVHKLLDEIK